LRRAAEAAREGAYERRRRLNERLRAEWIAGAEEEGRRRTGRAMTADELERVLRRYPGDIEGAGPRCGHRAVRSGRGMHRPID
jgi:hypothetical protein